MSSDYMIKMYNLCERDEDCERGYEHEGECGKAIRNGATVIEYI